jgi:twitching motility protein PilT
MDYKNLLDKLVDIAVREGASDIHFSASHHPTVRVSSALIPLVKENILTPEDTAGLAFALMGEENKKTFLADKEIDFAYSYSPNGGAVSARFRGNAFFQQGSVGVALRYIPNVIKTFNELGLPESLKDFAFKEQGYFLVVGPVGQGKSTTLASMVELINQERSEHIVTIEDPVEYIFGKGKSIIDQREVRFDTNDFHTALRAMFRQDVNVALIGEMRDPETISTSVTAAETGHLVLSTLHTNSASQTIDRIIDSFPGAQQAQIAAQLSNTLLGIFSQRLVPRISGGLIPAYELLIVNSAIANLIRERRTSEINMIIETSSEQGMVDMNHCLANLVRKGEITSDNAYIHSLNTKGLERLI